MDDKDERDVVSLLSQTPLGETDEHGVVNVAYIARLCAGGEGHVLRRPHRHRADARRPRPAR